MKIFRILMLPPNDAPAITSNDTPARTDILVIQLKINKKILNN